MQRYRKAYAFKKQLEQFFDNKKAVETTNFIYYFQYSLYVFGMDDC